MVKKIAYHYQQIPDIPPQYREKKKRPREIAVVDPPNCTGCEACVPFCPVDCIEHWPDRTFKDTIIQPVRVRLDECIGCKICVKVCEGLAWDAIRMWDTENVVKEFGIEIHDKYIPD